MIRPYAGDRWPWRGGDLQTLRNHLRGPFTRPRGPSVRVEFPLEDGSNDTLVGFRDAPTPGMPGPIRPLAVLVHGLTGCSDSAYVLSMADSLARRGYPVLRMNLRGAGASRALCRGQYHAGRSGDLVAVLADLPARLPQTDLTAGVALVGFSLGANMLLKTLGEGAHTSAPVSIRAAAAISAPIDLKETCLRFLEPRNAVYHRYLLRRMRRESLGGDVGDYRDAIERAGTVLAFDDDYVAPANGFQNAFDYYAQCSAARFLSGIRVPTLIVHARNDPWIPVRAYESQRWGELPNLYPILTDSGGHVGFHARDSREPYSNRVVADFLEARVAAGETGV